MYGAVGHGASGRETNCRTFVGNRFGARFGAARATVITLSAMHVVLPDTTELELPAGATGLDAARAIGPKLAEQAVLVRVDGRRRISARRSPTAQRSRS